MARFLLVVAPLAIALCSGCSTTSASRAGTNAESIEVIPLKHIDAERAAADVRSEHGRARIIAQPSMNSIVVAGSAAEVDEVRRAVTRIDRPG